MSHAIVAVSVSTTLCISASFGADVSPKAFSVEVPCWKEKLELVHCDSLIPQSFEPQVLEQFKLCHAGVLAVKHNAPDKLSEEGLNIFFCVKGEKNFLVLTRQGKTVRRESFTELPKEFVGQRARFFLRHKDKE